ncbi:MAG: tRNA (adenosine(37)-N6)-threonylcarbamoyltransferase complex ATPase subunit type 1 TsaE [Rikenellaceae bacterium]
MEDGQTIEREIAIKNVSDIDDVALWVLDLVRQRGCNVVAFYGEMGSGKTTLIGEIARQKRVTQTPSSPTFALVNDYSNEAGEVIHHFDFYRIENPLEVYDMGYQEYFYTEDLCLLEWPELIEELLPEDVLKIRITITGDHSREYRTI